MDWVKDRVLEREVRTPDGTFSLTMDREDLSFLYPGMVRYTLQATRGGEPCALFRTSTYEYSPTVPYDAESVARQKMEEWARLLQEKPLLFLEQHARDGIRTAVPDLPADAVIIQGSPRPDGNCSILAGWAADAVREAGARPRVVFLDDLVIHSCIGCYRCYNTGECTFDDDMGGVLASLQGASLLVICSPVYTNTVPGGLKTFLDRCQTYHARRRLFDPDRPKKGLLLSVAGRKGRSNFACVTAVVSAYFRNLGIVPSGEVLIDAVDEIRDVRTLQGLDEKVRDAVRESLRLGQKAPARR
ncbi:MAG: flavodoxin family protein [Methanomicrobiales archaeon]|nr:flavodoxin family protein [Methanomicrobiales archaeon]